ncbi:MAG: protein kinase [Clostridiales bacterium]|nr:protein kinase [Clostridiales bacterium]
MSDSLSFSNTISKLDIFESFTMSRAAMDDASERLKDEISSTPISNEQIKKGDEILSTYHVEDDAISGGMGSVWHVHHRSWNIDLAMKRPQPRFFAEGSRKKKEEFIAECENWINLGLHPNIVSCYYVRDIGGVPTIFSEWMDGGSLSDAIKSGTLYDGPEEDVRLRLLDLSIQMARGLRYAHGEDLIHQDIKPGNILLTKTWDAGIADFGLARARGRLTEAGQAASSGYTPQYCPQEQSDGAPAESWMDVYAWALTVLEMHIGKRVWNKGAQVRTNLKEVLSQLRYPASPEMEDLLTRCITTKECRIGEICDQLVKEYEAIARKSYPRKEPKTADQTPDSMNNRALSFLDLHNTEAAERCWAFALSRNAAHLPSLFNQGLHQWRSGKLDDETLVSRLTDADQHQFTLSDRWLHALDTERGVTSRLPYEQESVSFGSSGKSCNLCISEDGKTVVTVSNKELSAWNTDSGTCLFTTTYGKKQIAPYKLMVRISPDSRYIVFSERNERTPLFGTTPLGNFTKMLYIAEMSSGRILHTVQAHMASITAICFHPNGGYVYTGSSDQRICKWDLRSGAQVTVYSLSQPVLDMDISADGLYLFALTGGPGKESPRTLMKIHEENKETTSLLRPDTNPSSIRVSSDRNVLFFCGADTLSRMDLISGACLTVPLSREGRLIRLSSDGVRLVLSDSQTIKVFDSGDLRCLTTFNTPELSDGSADSSLLRFAASSLIENGKWGSFRLFFRGETSPAPWEICVIRSYTETVDARETWASLYRQTKTAILSGDFTQASAGLTQLQDSIENGSQSEMLTLYAEMAKRYRKERLLSMDEIRLSEIPESIAIFKPAPSPKGEKRAYSTDGRLLFTGKESGELILSEVTSGTVRFTIPTGVAVHAVAISPDNQTAVAANRNGQLVIIDIVNRRLARKDIPHSGTCDFLLFTPDGRHLLALSKGYSLDIWETSGWYVEASPSLIRSVTGRGLDAVTLAPEGRWLAYCEKDGNEIRIFDVKEKKAVSSIHVSSSAEILFFDAQSVLLFASDGRDAGSAYELIWKWTT